MWKKLLLLSIVCAIIVLFFATGLHEHLTFEAIKAQQARFQEIYAARPFFVIGLYLVVYILIVPINLPGATLLGLLAGALFGSVTGTVIVSFASSIGATMACALSRYLLRGWVRAKFPQTAAKVDRGVRREGAFYLFSMRLIPVVPFFMINMVMGLTAMRLSTFYWVSQLGMLPGTFVYVNAGSQISQLKSAAGIFSPSLLLSFALLGIFPLVARKLLNLYRARTGKAVPEAEEAIPTDMVVTSPMDAAKAFGPAPSVPLAQAAAALIEGCTKCGACVPQCAFLQKFGTPGDIAASLAGEAATIADPFQCSLCDLCGAVCPEQLSLAEFFLEMRRQAVAADALDLKRYHTILGYEARGQSERYSWYGLPQGCDTVFFPGCTLTGTRPDATWNLYEMLRRDIPTLGVALDCCAKPSHDLGRQRHFEVSFGPIVDYLASRGVTQVLVACPNCHKVFKQYGGKVAVRTVWEQLLEAGSLPAPGLSGQVALHDPCPLRREPAIQGAVRGAVEALGLTVKEMRHNGGRTLCCGEGGSVGFVNPAFAKTWGAKRRKESEGARVLTYCAGCAGFLTRAGMQVGHLADYLLDPAAALAGRARVARAPWTYLNRLKLKKRFKDSVAAANTGEQPRASRR